MSNNPISETTGEQSSGVPGTLFIVEACPECGVLHLGPTVPWHTFHCSAPEMQPYLAQIMGPYTPGTAQAVPPKEVGLAATDEAGEEEKGAGQ